MFPLHTFTAQKTTLQVVNDKQCFQACSTKEHEEGRYEEFIYSKHIANLFTKCCTLTKIAYLFQYQHKR